MKLSATKIRELPQGAIDAINAAGADYANNMPHLLDAQALRFREMAGDDEVEVTPEFCRTHWTFDWSFLGRAVFRGAAQQAFQEIRTMEGKRARVRNEESFSHGDQVAYFGESAAAREAYCRSVATAFGALAAETNDHWLA